MTLTAKAMLGGAIGAAIVDIRAWRTSLERYYAAVEAGESGLTKPRFKWDLAVTNWLIGAATAGGTFAGLEGVG